MFKEIKKLINIAGTDIINRIFESITIHNQQFNQDAFTNTETIITAFDNQFKNFTDILTSNFNI
jgi:hypothetical protein